MVAFFVKTEYNVCKMTIKKRDVSRFATNGFAVNTYETW